ncbi:ISNCY-like element ISPlas1 family transposase [Planctomyces sp. SH-PL62]|uniref:ISNCY-like element ISPlas1 family transposase n=1 Tax=Planctomyces sp. SH-PL62 TaxID=1636152 RepID=UPI00078D00CE|nr:ISNCY-like element ISPlas1 family transposase [Planctomyces sp. SH-PL62]AMV37394.1 Transposase DDE domain protein [Planctomyces sp. SH-PL62]
MLRNRYPRTDLFALVPQLGLRLEPQLEQLDRLLDDDELFELVRGDLGRRHPLTRSRGRPSTPVEVILRMLVVMRLYGWSYEQAEYFVNDSLVLRQFCRVYFERVPDDTTLIRWAAAIGPETLQTLNDRVVQLARSLRATRGRRLRVDTTAVETNVHFPTDSGLLVDGVRVVSRLLRRARSALGETAADLGEAFRSRIRTARRVAQQLHRLARRKGDQGRETMKAAYGRLIAAAKRTAAQGRRVSETLRQRTDEPSTRRLAERLAEAVPQLKRAIRQAERRVLKGESVPSGEKLLSLFEPHTQVVPRFKPGWPVEFGRKIRLDEVEGGIVAGYAVLEHAGGQDQPYLCDALADHERRFGRAPGLLAADRGMASAANERLAEQAGVKHVALPHVGKASLGRRAEEKGRRFREGYRFRAGIEGRIHALKRDYGLKRCRYRGERGFGRWVGWGVLAHNLAKVAGAARG